MIARTRMSLPFALVGFLTVGCSDVIHSEFATRAAAAEFIQNGWIPDVIPDTAVNIREWHNLDLNTGQGTFHFSQDEVTVFQKALSLHANETGLTSFPREQYETKGYKIYTYSNFTLAIDWTNCVGEFWLE